MGLYRPKKKGKESKIWYYLIYVDGERIRESTGVTNKRVAEDIYAKMKLEIREGRFFQKDQGNKRTFAELSKKYAREDGMQKAAKSQLRDQISLKHLLPVFGNKYLNQIAPNMINDYKVMRRNQKASASSINKELALAKHLYYVAMKQLEWVGHNPFSQVPLEKMPQERVKFLEEDQFNKLCAACDEQLRPIVILAANTGLRQDNLLSLTWQQINFRNESIVIEHTKNHERLGIPMNETVKNLLLGLNKVRRIDTPYVFYAPTGARLCNTLVSRWFKQASRRAGLEDFRFHDLRHHFASMLVQNGFDLYRVQRLLGHKTIAMTLRYSHLNDDNLKIAVKSLDKSATAIQTAIGAEVRSNESV